MRNSAQSGHMQRAPAVDASIDGNRTCRLSPIHPAYHSKAKGQRQRPKVQAHRDVSTRNNKPEKIAMGISRTCAIYGMFARLFNAEMRGHTLWTTDASGDAAEAGLT
jgi:hypothetical protein